MFDFAEARLQVHGSNVSVQDSDDRSPGSPDERTNHDRLEIIQEEKKEEVDEKDSKKRFLYRLGSIRWEIFFCKNLWFFRDDRNRTQKLIHFKD